MKNMEPSDRKRALRLRKERTRLIIHGALLLFMLALVTAVILDSRSCGQDAMPAATGAKTLLEQDVESLESGLELKNYARYKDSLKGYSIARIPGWQVEGRNKWTPYDVTFRGPYGLHLSVLVSKVPYDTYEALRAIIEQREIDMSIRQHIREIEFIGRPAVERTSSLHVSKVYMVDFITGHMAHHLLFSAPVEYFDQYLPLAKAYLETYETVYDDKETTHDGPEATE